MGSSINVTTDIFKADPYAWKCSLLYAGDEFDVSDQIINVQKQQQRIGILYKEAMMLPCIIVEDTLPLVVARNINYAGKQEFNFTGAYKAFTIEFLQPHHLVQDGGQFQECIIIHGNWYFRFAADEWWSLNFYSYDGII